MSTKSLEQHTTGLMTKGEPVPLEGVAIDATITGFFARVTITQRYRNCEPNPIEAVYVFPLDEGAAVCGFEAVVGNVHYVGAVKPKDEAFAAYDDAMTHGHGAYLLDEERPDVFTASVGNVAPGAEVLLKLTYVSELPAEGDAIRLTIPTAVSPRYAPPSDRVAIGRSEAEALNPPRMWSVPYGFTLAATIDQGSRIARVESPSHPVSVAINGASATVSLGQDRPALDRDFVLIIAAEHADEPRVWLERDEKSRHAVALVFQPRLSTAPQPCDVVFVVDRSGSMEGSSIESVRNALQLCLRSLQPGSHFDIVGFGSTFTSLFKQCRAYDEASLAAANAHVASLKADLGGTEILQALTFALDQPRTSERPLQIVLLTDGEVTNTDEVIALARSRSGSARLFTFGIGRGASHHLVRGLARAGKGAAEFIYPGERIETKVMRQFARLLTPALTDVSVDWGGLHTLVTTSAPPAVFASDRLVVYALTDAIQRGDVTLSARSTSGPVSWTLRLDPGNTRTGSIAGALAARARIRELEESDEWLAGRGSRQTHRKADRASSEIVKLATEYGLASRETSFVAIEHREAPVTGEVVLRRVPIAVTSGWGGSDVQQSAFAAPVRGNRLMADLGGRVDEVHSVVERAPYSPPMPQASHRPAMAAPISDAIARLKKGLATHRQASRPPVVKTPAPVARLVALQRADGSWALNESFAAAIGSSIEDLDRALGAGSRNAQARQAWATALALAFLEQTAMKYADEWRLLAGKAKQWLKQVSVDPPDAATWLEQAASFLQGSTSARV